jgi:hypothetical protein
VTVRYIGSGPYCYANSLAMVLGPAAAAPAVIEVLTGSPFGAELIGGTLPLFDPLGWDPGIGLDAATDLLGWTSTRTTADSAAEAAALLGTLGGAAALDRLAEIVETTLPGRARVNGPSARPNLSGDQPASGRPRRRR